MADRVAATNVQWETGTVPELVKCEAAPEFQAWQYAPWYQGGVWSAGKDEWDQGNATAAARFKGKGIRWTMDQITVLPRSADEATAMYRISHWTPGSPKPVQALFLEAFVKREGRWLLLRHTAEKAAPPKEE